MVDQNRQTKSLEKEMTFEGQHQKRVIQSPGIKNVSIDSEGDAERAVLQVKKAVDEERQKAVHCSGTCIGIPQIVPGKKPDDQETGCMDRQDVRDPVGGTPDR